MQVIKNLIKDIYVTHKGFIILFIFLFIPFVINGGLIITDYVYLKTGRMLTAYGLDNKDWLNFWQNYCSISVAFIGVYLVWNSSNETRKLEKLKEAKNYRINELLKEENVMVEIVENIEIGVAYNAVRKCIANKNDITETMHYLNEVEDRLNVAHVKFELLTDISMNYERGECAESNKDFDIDKLKEHRDLFYKIENEYLDLIQLTQNFIIKNGENLNSISNEDLMDTVKIIKEKVDLINIDRAKFVQYCKGYVDCKKQQIINMN